MENTKPGYALPELPETVAIFGGGRNTRWRMAPWLAERDVAYWGDIDSWGLTILAHARQALPGITALMMDHETLMAHMDFAVEEPRSTNLPAIGLLAEER
ncbi:Wadjet anti-phage system protein JetD domain-containing protein, partial [Pseudomonas viridiflava]|uniref:Wadjet anti-phage system protein JetD domain-containing protein n=1 Tax=Pseudomonas viridiflava TaxID=33069 RepID=UPI001F15648A